MTDTPRDDQPTEPDEAGAPQPVPFEENRNTDAVSSDSEPDEPRWLTEEHLVPPAPAVRPPGPGLPESLLWLFGAFGVQIGGGVAVVLVLAVAYIISQGVGPEALRELRDPGFEKQSMPWIIGGTQAIMVLAAMLAVVLRLGRAFPRRLALTPIPLQHAGLILLLVLPLALTGSQLFQWASEVWEVVLRQWPGLRLLDEVDSVEMVRSLVEVVPYPALLLMLAVAPAVWEELVFRGVIGRGLVARWGVPAGVLLTSFLFAVAHVRPPHAFGLLPLAIVIHLLHIATRSFWAPVALHFLNNAMAVSVLSFPLPIEMPGVADEEPLPLAVFLAAVFCVIVLASLVWQMRVRFRRPDGSLWDPGYPAVELPPAQADAVRECGRPSGMLLVLALVAVVAFGTALAWSALTV